MAATVEVVRAREAQVEGAVADVEALKVAGPVAVGLARVVAVEMAQGTVVGVATSWAWAKPGLSGAGPTRPLQSVHQSPIRLYNSKYNSPSSRSSRKKRLAVNLVHACIASKRVVSQQRPHYRCNQRSDASAAPGTVPV
jgi:hypothetical protein